MFCLHSIVKLPLALNDNATTYRQKGAEVIPFNTKIPTCKFQFLFYASVIVIFFQSLVSLVIDNWCIKM